jgi:molybdopterin synthase sulfur carrier subunit
MASINVHYFASLREATGVSSEELHFSGTYAELYESLSQKYSFNLPRDMVMLAVDDEFSRMESTVADKAKVVFIPPVAGG